MVDARDVITVSGMAASGLPLSHGVSKGGTVFVGGKFGYNREPPHAFPATVEAETANALEYIRLVVAETNLNFNDIMKVTVFISDWRHFEEFNATYRRYFADGGFPARTTVQATLGRPEARIEIEAIACRPTEAKASEEQIGAPRN